MPARRILRGWFEPILRRGTASIGDVDIRIEPTDGAAVAIDQSTHPIAIIDGDEGRARPK